MACLAKRSKKILQTDIIEAIDSFLMTQYSSARNKVRGLMTNGVHAFYSTISLVLTREAVENIGRPEKAAPPTYFTHSLGQAIVALVIFISLIFFQ